MEFNLSDLLQQTIRGKLIIITEKNGRFYHHIPVAKDTENNDTVMYVHEFGNDPLDDEDLPKSSYVKMLNDKKLESLVKHATYVIDVKSHNLFTVARNCHNTYLLSLVKRGI